MKIKIKLKNIVPDYIEKYVCTKIRLDSFGTTPESELLKIQQSINNKFNYNIHLQIINSIKSTYIKESIMKHHHRLKKYSKHIIDSYLKVSILDLSIKFNLSPMTLLRFILEQKYNEKLKILVANNKLNPTDKEQFKIASSNDIYANIDQLDQSIESIRFEKLIEEYLMKNNIKYLTQEELTIKQIKKYGKSISTPDFEIKSELYINDHRVNWIDAKNFYGSNNKFQKSKINKQINKYIVNYGDGCIIYNHGFNSKLIFDKVLILDYESLTIK